MTLQQRPSGWARPAFWIWAALGVPVMAAAWLWFGLSFMEEMTEHCKALGAQTTMQGFGALLGLPPLVLAHAVGLLVMLPVALADPGSRPAAWLAGVSAVVVPSLLGMLLAQWFWAGQLFSMGASAAYCGL